MEACYFLPGTMCTEALWKDVWQQLDKTINPIHQSIPQGSNNTDILQQLALKLPTEPFHLVGFSMGGYFAMLFAVTYPERVKTLTIIAASAWGLEPREKKQRLQIIQNIKLKGYQGISPLRVRHFLDESQYKNDEIVKTIIEMDRTLGVKVLINQLTATSNRAALATQLKVIPCPVRLIAADNDKVAPLALKKKMAPLFNQSNLITVKNCGHMIPLESPQIIARTVNQIISTSC